MSTTTAHKRELRPPHKPCLQPIQPLSHRKTSGRSWRVRGDCLWSGVVLSSALPALHTRTQVRVSTKRARSHTHREKQWL